MLQTLAQERDLSEYVSRSVLFPRPPVEQKKQFVPVLRNPTIDTRGIFLKDM